MLDANVMRAMSTTHLIATLQSCPSLTDREHELLSRLEFTYAELTQYKQEQKDEPRVNHSRKH